MYHTIHEPITVAGVYEHGRFRLVKFRWKQHVYQVEKVCSMHDFRDGSIPKRRFSVSISGTTYLLEFDRHREVWFLEQIWVAD
jgi:hypothetical protein